MEINKKIDSSFLIFSNIVFVIAGRAFATNGSGIQNINGPIYLYTISTPNTETYQLLILVIMYKQINTLTPYQNSITMLHCSFLFSIFEISTYILFLSKIHISIFAKIPFVTSTTTFLKD